MHKMKFNLSTLMILNFTFSKTELWSYSWTPPSCKKSKSRFSSRTSQNGSILGQWSFLLTSRDTSLQSQLDQRNYFVLSASNSLLYWNHSQPILKSFAWSEILLKSTKTLHLSKLNALSVNRWIIVSNIAQIYISSLTENYQSLK